jgi:hypothetical protein
VKERLAGWASLGATLLSALTGRGGWIVALVLLTGMLMLCVTVIWLATRSGSSKAGKIGVRLGFFSITWEADSRHDTEPAKV